ncbi:MAG: glutamate--tRNA ligase [Halothiobacillaceae bacterium]|nr:glutamate--tRNA ligase [Halothiobacillaceae bacterium]
MKKIRTRFAPSPTGYLHIGGARTALFSYLYARRHGGDFVLRVEDTDLERSTPESVNAILEGMAWLNLEYDEGPFYQTQRFERYKEIVQQLLASGHAYYCYMPKDELDALREGQMARGEKPRYDGRYRDFNGTPPEGVAPVVRFKNPLDGEVVIEDMVRGRVVIRNEELDDLIIARSDGTPTYNLSVVVDDLDMGITHVVRGDDHLNNTPRQINIFRALDAEPPVYGHLPMILGPDGAKLSKRHGAVSVMQYHEEGYLPDALLNYLVRLGWSHGDQEVFSREEMVRLFDVADVNQSASAINPDKLLWLNQHYIKTSDPAYVARFLGWHLGRVDVDPSQGPALDEVVVALRERSRTLVEMAQQAACYFRDELSYDDDAATKHLNAQAEPVLRAVIEALQGVTDWRGTVLEPVIKDTVKALGIKFPMLAQPMRVALTGSTASPSIDATLALVGRERSLVRLQKALTFIEMSKSS